MSVSNVLYAQDELCTDGILLFREDFGGNDPSDPVAGTNPAPGMTSSYTQIYDTATCRLQRPCTGMGSGRYLLTKIGYRNAVSYTYSHWFIMDDHTYPNDYTRGYLLEIDGRTDNATLFETVIDGLCEGTKLTFSAYVVNLTTSYSYDHGNNGDPQMSFVLQDPETGAQLTTPYKTGPIPVDRSYQGMSGEWRNSAHWNLVGMNFTVPPGRTAIKLIIKNACTAANGNDFAMDDIEIRLCAPPVTIEGEPEVCADDATTLTANFTNDGTFPEPLEYKWWFSEDSLTWTELNEASPTIAIPAMHETHAGWYKAAVSGAGNIGSVNCRALSEPFRLNIKECTPPEPEPELCTGGILLFREDFGGNEPNDPKISTTPVPGMSYTQVTTDALGSMGAGKYLVTKQGYCNGNGTSQWHLQDDHTHFGDLTRGYLLEIDGRAGSAAFYQTTIDNLCEGIELTFSAYVANVMTWGMYMGRPGVYAYPRLKFVLTNPLDNSELATYDTGDIPFDSAFIGDNMCWQQSVEWQLVGMNFTVPVGVESIQLSIYNNVSNSNGNDFAIDDIEIHLCMTPDTIRTDTTVCDTLSQIQWRDKIFNIADTLRDTLLSSCGFDSIYYVMRVQTEHCESPCPEMHYATRDTTVCDTLMPFTWHGLLFNKPGSQTILLKDEQGCDSIEIDYTLSTFHCEDFCLEGKLLFREDFGGNDAGDSEISCAHVSGIANFYTNACQEVRKHPEYGMSTMNYVLTKKGQGNRQWHVQDDHTYPNDYTHGYFLEVDGYGGTIYKTTVNNLYEGMELTFSAYIANLHDSCVIANMRKNYGYTYPRFKFILKDAESNAELATYTTGNILPDITTPCVLAKSALWQLKGMKYVVPEGVSSIQMLINNDVASYDGNDFGIDDIEIRLCYMPAKKIVQDTIICDTIDNIVWRNKIYPLKNELRDTVYDSSGADSIYYILNVIMEHCCPEIKEKTITIGTLCDTLLPYTLYFRDTILIFKEAGDILLEIQHPKWRCIDTIYTLHLDTVHCERLYPIIVNKYNWQLLLDNVTLRRLFPDRTARSYQWYKDDLPIPGATDDDYSEQNELHGRFQLRLELDDNQTIWSNILEINVQRPTTNDQLQVHIFNFRGLPVREDQLTRGIYLYRYQQGDTVWTEKRLIP